ncbi:MAG: AAA family ATPase [Hahellaceae bacterium]|nr:AAA family ATPase [Hahellaceae bacterium]
MLSPVPGYRITHEIFSGEHTAVARAIRESDQQSVVLKQLSKTFPENGTLSRFLFSFEVANKFNHPNITKNIAWHSQNRDGTQTDGLSSTESSKPTIVLEDRQGVDLFAYLKKIDADYLPIDVFLNIAVQLAEALSVIHYQQVIHKDLHPGNILYTPETGLAQITDFGLASLLSREQPVLQPPERLEGVLDYISPEQTGRMNRALDYRSDFYTLGCTFYHMLCGQPPFQAKDALGLVHAHMAKMQQPLIDIRPDIPAVLSAIVDKLLMKTAEDRYQSALGLKKDLDKVRLALAANRPVQNFPLGMEDISDRLQIPQKLYGREAQVQTLLQRFFQAAGGKPKLLALAGYSGIGKSALVHEVHKPIATYNGFFCAGKFDQFQKNIPYSALQTALKSWIQYTLSLPENTRQQQQARLLSSLGANARVMIDFMPDFSWVLGNLPPVAQLGADETQNRFHLVFQLFIKEITRDHPLVLFIDDIQWADRGTLNLLPQLMSEEHCRLLVIVAYRDNEVDDNHPAMQALQRIAQSKLTKTTLSTVTLGPLTIEEISQLMQDALHLPTAELTPLVTLVQAKTAGNPFFIAEFLKTLYTEKLLNFDLGQQRWCWNISDIEAKGITDNVVDLMLSKMALLPPQTQTVIQLAACVGSRFSLEMLAAVAEQPLSTITRYLWPALRDGLLLQDGGDWFLGLVQPQRDQSAMMGSEGPVLSQFSPVSPQCRFLHDRMLQAAYHSLSTEKRQQIHLRVGRLLLREKTMDSLSNDDCFAIVEQLNNARTLITDADECQKLMLLNLRAAQQAKASSVWEAAARYSSIGIDLLPTDCWRTDAASAQLLYTLNAETEYLDGKPDISDQRYSELFAHLDNRLMRADICATRLVQSIGRGDWMNGVQHGKQGLSFLGMHVPDKSTLAQELENELVALHKKTPDGVIQSAKDLPDMTETDLLVAMRILPNLNICCAIVGDAPASNYCVIKGCNLVVDYGKSDLAAILLTCYANFLRQRMQLPQALKQAIEAKYLADSYEQCREITNCYNLLAGCIWNLHKPYRDCVDMHITGMRLGLENGEVARAAMNYCTSLFLRLSQGEPLSRVEHEAKLAEDFLVKRSAFHPLATILRKHTAALTTDKNTATALDDSVFDISFLAKIQRSFHFSYLLHYRSELAFWSNDYEKSFKLASNAKDREELFPLTSFSIDHQFLLGFLSLQKWHDVTDEERARCNDCLDKIRQFSDINPANFKHKYLLLLAEKARVEDADTKAVCALYRDAIASAKAQGFIQFQALANECCGLYWMDSDFESIGLPFIREALYLYRRWGCQIKVNYLRSKFDSQLPQFDGKRTYSISESEMHSAQENKTLDMASVMKSAQVISSELQIAKLAAKVLEVIVESAGASSAALIINQNNAPHLAALVSEEQQLYTPEVPPLLENCEDLPVNLIRYVLNSHEKINIGDVLSDRTFSNDPYLLQNQPRSVLCLPVEYRDNTVGALYLENMLTIDAFTPDRLDVIKLLLSQAAISFENAQLFNEVHQLNQTLEQKVEQRTADLKLANEELNAFSFSVSHDLRAPLRAIRGFTRMLYDDHGASIDRDAVELLNRIDRCGNKMQDLIDGLLELSRMQRQELIKEKIDLSLLVSEIFTEMHQRFPDQHVISECAPHCEVYGDKRMLYSALENLINNAWKYSSKVTQPIVEFAVITVKSNADIPKGFGDRPETLPAGTPIYLIKDNGAGFSMDYAERLFGTFQRLHTEKEFSGTGIGLATVKRIFGKHGGNIWATAQPNEGAVFYFCLPRNEPVHRY